MVVRVAVVGQMENDIITRKLARTDWFGVTCSPLRVYLGGDKEVSTGRGVPPPLGPSAPTFTSK